MQAPRWQGCKLVSKEASLTLGTVHAKLLQLCLTFFVTLWMTACQAPLSMGFSRQENWSGLLFPSPGDLSNQGIKPAFLMSPALAGGFFTTSAMGSPLGTKQVLK